MPKYFSFKLISNNPLTIKSISVSDQSKKCFLPLTQSVHLLLRTCVLSHTTTDGPASIFSLTPKPRPRIKLTSLQLHLFEGP